MTFGVQQIVSTSAGSAMSVFAAITATFVKAPAEKSLLSYVQYVRELLDSRACAALVWVDTRDMFSDGMTKGNVERDLLHMLMDGRMEFKHSATFKVWSSKIHKAPEVASKLEIDVSSLEGFALTYLSLSYRNLD